jgi:hypothetical protein
MESAQLLEVIETLLPPQNDIAPEQTRTTSWAMKWRQMASHGVRAAGGVQKNGLPLRDDGSGQSLRPGLDGNNEGYGFQTSASLYEVSEGRNLFPGMADG